MSDKERLKPHLMVMMEEYRLDAVFPGEAEIPEEMAGEVPVALCRYLSGGVVKSWEGPFRDVFSPVCVRTDSGIVPKRIGKYPLMTEKESLEALYAAHGAYDNGRGQWPAMSPGQRIGHMERFIAEMVLRRDRITRLIMWEIGKTQEDARKEFDRTVNYVRGTIRVIRGLAEEPPRIVREHAIIGRIGRAPLGVVLCMGPFNYPLFETFTALAPALLAGNTAVFKAPRFGSLLFDPLLDLFREAFPPGVVNSVFGEGKQIIPPLLSTGMVDILAFIGTGAVAAYLRGLHPKPHRLRCVLGLEAKNPAVVLADADLDSTLKECVAGALSFNGQRCAALKIFFVHASIVQEFLDRFSAALGELKCGMPWEENVVVTPLVEPGKPQYLRGLIKDAMAHGASVVNGGGGITSGTFFYPALLYPVTSQMRIYHEEQFGPVIPIIPFDDPGDPVRYVTASNYGQQASIFGKDREVVARLVGCFTHQVSRININCQCQRTPDAAPFSGRKDSAEGSLSVSDPVTPFTSPFFISARDTEMDRSVAGLDEE